MSGKFIVIEGLDGSGKSTQIRFLEGFLEAKGNFVIVTSEPTSGEFGQRIRRVLQHKEKMSEKELQILFAQDREEHLRTEVLPALEKNKTVLCDRYFLSTIAFGSLGADVEFLKELNSEFLVPDLTIFLDVEPEECMRRIQARGNEAEFFEKLEKMKKIRETYLSLIDYPNYIIVDGSGTPEQVFERVKKIIEEKL